MILSLKHTLEKHFFFPVEIQAVFGIVPTPVDAPLTPPR